MGRELADGRKQASVMAAWMMPIYCTAGIAGPDTYSSNMRIPIDNESLMFYRLRWSYAPIPQEHIDEYAHGEFFYPALTAGSWKTRDNVSNDYNIDRVAQRNFTYSGIKTFPLQDIAMMENQWGPVAQREQEHLSSTDFMIIKVRRRLLAAARAMAKGIEPEAPWHPEDYRWHRESVTLPDDATLKRRERRRSSGPASIVRSRLRKLAAGRNGASALAKRRGLGLAMLSNQDNELVTNTNPGTPMGELFRRFWLPVALSEELPRPDCAPTQGPDPGREADRLPRHLRSRRPRRRLLPASWRASLLRPQRRGRPALRLPRLEVRRRRHLRRPALGPGRRDVQEQDSHQVLSLPGSGRDGLRLHGTGRQAAALPRVRVDESAEVAYARQQVPAGVQLPAGDGGRL